jgi:hypothetical protein
MGMRKNRWMHWSPVFNCSQVSGDAKSPLKLPDLNGVSGNEHFSLNNCSHFLLSTDSLDFLIS